MVVFHCFRVVKKRLRQEFALSLVAGSNETTARVVWWLLA